MTAGVLDTESVAVALAESRERSTLLTGAMSDPDLVEQHSPLMSPLVWDLAHVGNYEELWIAREVGGRAPLHPELDDLYDAFRHPRAQRRDLPLLPPLAARRYVTEVRSRSLDVLERVGVDGSTPLLQAGFVFGLVAQHEHQHAETMLATHQLRSGEPILTPIPVSAPTRRVDDSAEVVVAGGAFQMGTDVEPWAYDNERPAHEVTVAPFAIDRFPVTNRRYMQFIADGGYQRAALWSPSGWQHRLLADLSAPAFWTPDGTGEWRRRRFGVEEPVALDEPVQHVCWYEAEAFARWEGRRLPTEAEWEKAAGWDPLTGRCRRYPWGDHDPSPTEANLGGHALRPSAIGSYPSGAAASGAEQMVGDVWEWTASAFRGYPGFRSFPYPEYSEVFFGEGHRVLRGGSWATHRSAVRTTFRNWDLPIRRQIFAGFRTARDAAPIVAG